MKKINPKIFNLSPRLNIQKNQNNYYLLIKRKSRIIMKDGIKIVQNFQRIKQNNPTSKMFLKTSTPICSKTQKFLIEKNIDIIKN